MIGAVPSLLLMVLLQARPLPAEGQVVPALVSGNVVPADAAAPLASATVTFRPLDDAPTSTGSVRTSRLQSKSDRLGRISFMIPPGRYSVSTEREGYIREEHFQLGVNQPQQTILTVSSGQRIETLVVLMNPAPTISGYVLGPEGHPVAAATVQAYRVTYTPLGLQLVATSRVLSHEGGEYRLFNLEPGTFYVSASISTQSQQAWKSVVTFTPNLPDPGEGFMTAFFPDETSIKYAQQIYIGDGQSAPRTDITFRNISNYRVTAKLTAPPNGQPFVNPNVSLVPAGVDLAAAESYRMGRSGLNFTLNHVAEGSYTIVATADYVNSAGGFTTTIATLPRTLQISDNTEIGLEAIGAIEIAGRVVLDNNLPEGLRYSAEMKAQLIRTDHYSSEIYSADIANDGSFTLSNVGPGDYDAFLLGFPTRLFVSDVTLGGGLQRLGHLQINASQPPRTLNLDTQLWQSSALLRITLSSYGGFAEGVVSDGARVSASAKVILVPGPDAVRRRKDRYFLTSTDESGKFKIEGIPPGSYLAFSFQKLEPDVYFDSAFLGLVQPRGSVVEIKSGSTETLRLNIITPEELSRLVR